MGWCDSATCRFHGLVLFRCILTHGLHGREEARRLVGNGPWWCSYGWVCPLSLTVFERSSATRLRSVGVSGRGWPDVRLGLGASTPTRQLRGEALGVEAPSSVADGCLRDAPAGFARFRSALRAWVLAGFFTGHTSYSLLVAGSCASHIPLSWFVIAKSQRSPDKLAPRQLLLEGSTSLHSLPRCVPGQKGC